MERALKELQGLINCYEYWVKDCSPYFREPKEIFDARKNELIETLKELKQAVLYLKILENKKIKNGQEET